MLFQTSPLEIRAGLSPFQAGMPGEEPVIIATMKRLLLLYALTTVFGSVAFSPVAEARKPPKRHWVKPYTRKNGTFVAGHFAGGSSGVWMPRSSVAPYRFPRLTSPRSARTSANANYPAQPTLEPSWIRQQRLERSQGIVSKSNSATPKASSLAPFSGECAGVIDGKTMRVVRDASIVTVVLYALEAPSTLERWGSESKASLSKFAFNRIVQVYPKSVAPNGELTAWVFVGKTGLNAGQIQQGLARWSRETAPREKKIAAFESKARTAKLGVWSGIRAAR
jgi:endonuclease YncB( thermonuclease family)